MAKLIQSKSRRIVMCKKANTSHFERAWISHLARVTNRKVENRARSLECCIFETQTKKTAAK